MGGKEGLRILTSAWRDSIWIHAFTMYDSMVTHWVGQPLVGALALRAAQQFKFGTAYGRTTGIEHTIHCMSKKFSVVPMESSAQIVRAPFMYTHKELAMRRRYLGSKDLEGIDQTKTAQAKRMVVRLRRPTGPVNHPSCFAATPQTPPVNQRPRKERQSAGPRRRAPLRHRLKPVTTPQAHLQSSTKTKRPIG